MVIVFFASLPVWESRALCRCPGCAGAGRRALRFVRGARNLRRARFGEIDASP
jgi:hypothetical protein